MPEREDPDPASAPPPGPGVVARAFFRALNAGRWAEAASYVLPEVAERQRLLDLTMVLDYAEKRERGVAMDGSGSFTLASDDVLDEEKLRRFARTLVPGYRGASTVADVAAFTPAGMMALMLENAVSRPAGESVAPIRLELLRVSRQGAQTARAVYRELWPEGWYDGPSREPWEQPVMDPLEELELRRVDGRWWVVPGFSLLSRGSGLRVIFFPPHLGGTKP